MLRSSCPFLILQSGEAIYDSARSKGEAFHLHTQVKSCYFQYSYISWSQTLSPKFPEEHDMASSSVFKVLTCLSLLIGTALSIPSFDHGSFDDGSFLALGSFLHPRSEPFEIRGVYGGRKKRYIVERQEPSACPKECKQKPLCMPTLGEIVKDCACQKCPTGIPALDGKSCQDNCPQGKLAFLTINGAY
jgi:hypothetical protein